MPAISVSMRGTNWLSADGADFTDRETLVDRPSAPCLLLVRVLCSTGPASFDLLPISIQFICAIGVICGSGLGQLVFLADHLLRPEHRTSGAESLIRSVP